MRFGIGMNTDHALEEVEQQFPVTRERIPRIEAKALCKLKPPPPASGSCGVSWTAEPGCRTTEGKGGFDGPPFFSLASALRGLDDQADDAAHYRQDQQQGGEGDQPG